MKVSGISTLAALLVVTPLVAGCPARLGSEDYSRDQARQAMEVQMGQVEQVRSVNIEGTKTAVGPAAGAVVGGVAGSTVGGGKGSVIAATVGAVLGGLGGAAAEEAVTKKPGIEVTVRLDNGRLIAVVQEDSGEPFAVGDRVRVLTGGGATRVSH
jgi:outer membrane lipoprotein SlyB